MFLDEKRILLIKHLPMSIQKAAINNAAAFPDNQGLSISELQELDLRDAFVWDKSPEGFKYWYEVFYDNLENQ